MKNMKNKMLMLCLSVIAATGLGMMIYSQYGVASDPVDEDNIGLVVDKKDHETLKISLSNVADVVKALQFSLQIDGEVEFDQESLAWLVQSTNQEAIKTDVKVDEGSQTIEFLIVSNQPLQKKDAGVIEIAEIKIKPLVNKPVQYTIKSATSGDGTAYKYVVNATNKQVTGPAFNLTDGGVLSFNIAPTLRLIDSPQVINGKIYLTIGDEFTLEQQKSFVVATDGEGNELRNVSVSGTVDTNIVGSYLLTYHVSDSVGDEATLVVPVIVENKVEDEIPNPVITGVKSEVALQVGDSFDPLEGVLAWDYLDRQLEIELSGDYEETLVDGRVTKTGIYTIYYNTEDRYGNVAAGLQTTLIVEEDHDHGGEDNNTGGGDNNTGGEDNNTGGGDNNTGGEDNNTGEGDNNTSGEDNNTGGEDSNTGEGDNNVGDEENSDKDLIFDRLPESIQNLIQSELLMIVSGEGTEARPVALKATENLTVDQLKTMMNGFEVRVEKLQSNTSDVSYAILLKKKTKELYLNMVVPTTNKAIIDYLNSLTDGIESSKPDETPEVNPDDLSSNNQTPGKDDTSNGQGPETGYSTLLGPIFTGIALVVLGFIAYLRVKSRQK